MSKVVALPLHARRGFRRRAIPEDIGAKQLPTRKSGRLRLQLFTRLKHREAGARHTELLFVQSDVYRD
jgi:hypothetical protein